MDDFGYNPYRDEYLYWYTEEGYIIAQDITSMTEFVQMTGCPRCQNALRVVAKLNREGQGLVEFVCLCSHCRQITNIIFDISNEVYQQWWADQMGELYMVSFEGQPRFPHHPPD